MNHGRLETPGSAPSPAVDYLCTQECLSTPPGFCFLLYILPAKTSHI